MITEDLKLCKNCFGKISDEIKERLIEYCLSPSADKWDDIQGIILILTPFLTLWQAVIIINPSFPKRGRATDIKGRIVEEWGQIPTANEICQAIGYATH